MSKRRFSPFSRWLAALRARLVKPLFRSSHPPEYVARSVMFGLAIALTPTTGAQMLIVLGVWLLVNRLWPRRHFSLVVALAWTWVSNVFTLPPLYYVYVVTGRVLLGRWDRLRGYEAFSGRIQQHLSDESGSLATIWVYAESVVAKFGLALILGSLPWTALGAWLGYRWSLGLVLAYRAARARRKLTGRSAPRAPDS